MGSGLDPPALHSFPLRPGTVAPPFLQSILALNPEKTPSPVTLLDSNKKKRTFPRSNNGAATVSNEAMNHRVKV